VAKRRLVPVIAAITVLAASTLSACATDGHSDGKRVSLVPVVSQRGDWQWSGNCPYGPRVAIGCAVSGPQVGPAQLAGNEWNLGSGSAASESVAMSVDSAGSLSLKANLSTAPPCTASTCLTSQANTWVRGFPSVLYGIDQCHAATSPAQSPQLLLPMKVAQIPADLIGRATYDEQADQVTHDVAYDIWLSPTATKTPCQSDGTVEVMVWTDYNAAALLPDSLKVATTSLPLSVDGKVQSGEQSWSVYVNNVFGGGHTQPWGGTVWLVPNGEQTTKTGTVSVDLSAALTAAGSVLQRRYGWAPFASSYWLDTVALGIEYGPQGGNPYATGPADFSLNLSSYCLVAGTTVTAATC
jgi:hypothetical protein